ncbi:MAG TPA: ABC transporter substrate-binding protein [Candidatus Nanopelagicales bacterium]|nr:ABC transporter substrate-binding protein [Candidatus Nanopelagicales bacterium]
MTTHHRTTRPHRLRRALAASAVAVLAATGLAACGTSEAATPAASGSAEAPTLRLGYFANITHALPLIGVQDGTYARTLGSTKLETQVFNAGPAAVEALFAGAIDAAYVGPNPAINAFTKSSGEAVRIVAGASSGGAQLVVQPDIASAADLKGKTVASPQLGGTQDVALRYWLKQQGLSAPVTGAGDVTVAPQENAQTLDLFKAGTIAGAWVPEPWASRLVTEGGGKVLVDEKDLWPNGRFVTTHLIVSTEFLQKYPGTVKKLIEAEAATLDEVTKDPAAAQRTANAALKALTGKQLKDAALARAFGDLTLTLDPVASSLQAAADHGVEVGTTKKADLSGIYDLTILNAVLKARGEPTVSAAGLGQE